MVPWTAEGIEAQRGWRSAKAGSRGHHRLCPGLALPWAKLPLSMHSAGPGLRGKGPKISLVSSLLVAFYPSSFSSFSHHDPKLI